MAGNLNGAAVRTVSLFMLLSILSAAAWAGPKIESWHTENGAKVMFVHAPELPMLDIRVVFAAGSVRDTKPGVAALTNALLDQGAGDWNADQIAERMEGVGAELGNGALRDMAWVSARTLTREPALQTTLTTLAAVLGRPQFPEDEFERLRKTTLVAIRKDEQQPSSVGEKAFYRALFGAHPYATDPTGDTASVQSLTGGELLDFYRRYYVAANAVVAMVGDIDRAHAVRIAERLSAGLAAGEPAPALPPVPALAAGELQRLDFPSSQSHLLAGQPGMRRGDPDYFTLYVGNHVLGGNGLVSQLSQEVREKRGLSYSVYSYFLPMQQDGPFLMGLQTKNVQVDDARQVLMDTLRRFREQGPTEEELRAAKQNITGGFPLRIASNSKIIEYLAMIGFYGLPLDYLDEFNGKVEAVTAEQVRDAFQRRLDPERFVTVVVGPVEPPELAESASAGR
jgi:zinc protease